MKRVKFSKGISAKMVSKKDQEYKLVMIILFIQQQNTIWISYMAVFIVKIKMEMAKDHAMIIIRKDMDQLSIMMGLLRKFISMKVKIRIIE
jgi:hypothetical protein